MAVRPPLPSAPGARLLAAALLLVAVGVGSGLALTRSGSKPRKAGRPAIAITIRWLESSTWAHILHPDVVHAAPSADSHGVGRLRYLTEDGYPEVYLVLGLLRGSDHRTWAKIALPKRPNGTVGYVHREALGRLRKDDTWLVVNRAHLDIRFYRDGKPLWRAPVGIGKPSTPTPTGLFWVREEFVLPDQAFYGPYAFGTSAYASVSDWPGGGVVGLHGTSLPQLIPGTPSHGCIRLRNGDILWLARHVPVGTPIAIVD